MQSQLKKCFPASSPVALHLERLLALAFSSFMLRKEDKNKGSRSRLVFVTKLLRVALNSFFKDREFTGFLPNFSSVVGCSFMSF